MTSALLFFFFFQAEDGIRDDLVTGVQTCALPISFLSGIHVQRIKTVDGVDGSWRRNDLVLVEEENQVLDGRRIRGASGSVLIFSAHVEKEAAHHGAARCPAYEIRSLVVRPSKIVGDCLAKVVAIAQWRPGNIHVARVDRIYLR